MSRRTLEQLNIRKQQKIVVAHGYPSDTEGANGELQLRITRDNGLMLFARAYNKWHSTPLQIRHVSKKRDRVILQQGRTAKYPGELSLDTDGSIKYKSAGSATPRQILDNVADIGSFTIQAANTDEGYIVIKGGINNGAASIRFFPDKGADSADKFQIYAEDAATQDGLRFAKMSAADGSRVDLMKMTYGTGDAAGNSEIGLYAPVVCSSSVQAVSFTGGGVVDEDDMASDSATRLPTQQSVKAYVDSKTGVPMSLTGATLTSSGTDDNLLSMTQTLNAGSGENNAFAAENYAMIQGTITNTDSAGWDNAYSIRMKTGGANKFTADVDGNVVAGGTVSSSNGVCDGSNFRHLIHSGFDYNYAAGTKVYLPLVGYILERNTLIGANEFLTFVAPYDGYLNQVIIRSEELCGSTVVGLHKSSTGTEVPNSTAAATVTVNMAADDTAYKFSFTSSNTFSAGDILAISFDPTNDANDTQFTIEFILDSSSGL